MSLRVRLTFSVDGFRQLLCVSDSGRIRSNKLKTYSKDDEANEHTCVKKDTIKKEDWAKKYGVDGYQISSITLMVVAQLFPSNINQ